MTIVELIPLSFLVGGLVLGLPWHFFVRPILDRDRD